MKRQDPIAAMNDETHLEAIFDRLEAFGLPVNSNARLALKRMLVKQIDRVSEILISYDDVASALRSIRCMSHSVKVHVLYSLSVKGVGLVAVPLLVVSEQDGVRRIGHHPGDKGIAQSLQWFLKRNLGIDPTMYSMHGIVINIQPIHMEKQNRDIYEN